MKVTQIMQVSALNGSSVIAGNEGMHREVLHVNMMDAPDIARFLKPNELLVTTAYHVKDQPQLLVDLVEQMDQKGCAALGIKTKRFLRKIPEEVIQRANELAFPIIELPLESSLGDIVNQVLSSILDMRTNELRFAIETHKQFSNHIMSGKGIHKLLKSLAEMIGYPVFLLDQYGKPMASSHTSKKTTMKMEELYIKDSISLFPDTSFFTFSTLEDKETYSVFLVFTHERKAGFLVVMGDIHPDNHSETLTIEQATNVISFELMKENALKQYTRRVKNEFFFRFSEGIFTSDEEVVNRAKEFQLDNNNSYICATGQLEINEFSGSYTKNQLEIDAVYAYIEDELVSLSLSTHLFTRGDLCILLFELPKEKEDLHAYIMSSLGFVQTKVQERFNRHISFGVSNLSRNFLNVKTGFKEAQDALHNGKLSGQIGFIQRYQTKDVMELLRVIPRDDLQEFYENSLQQLAKAAYDQDGTLLHTLFVYLESHCQISETAKRLYVHRNTVVYRLEKCEELLGRNITDAETTLQIRLALRIKTLLGL
ncbi:PucR family transcriptional regulator [Aquibacillus koreensis]|uniref:PucR family transcriptional regulator n=1 Tax=Aquibacillus koreensis TaxID=279446 RepID=A0A9X3WM79_9BACI|nr:PucR family transcriptional regulator [Aquibacillus koreensis]MCT2537779.1 PucR family transcriptional regulator [Aquibacillus koreensis]MDC3421188.1 PucR family transcriptional regulator [Aquibacillus koreensis]